MRHCWYDFENGRTCMLLAGHDGPHKPTPDNDILVSLRDDGLGLQITVVP